MKTTIQLLKDAVNKHGLSVDAGSMFELIDTPCSICCEQMCGGNMDCPVTPACPDGED